MSIALARFATEPPAVSVLRGDWEGYQLLDSGGGRKLEAFGAVRVIRGEPKAWWSPALPDAAWDAAVAEHEDERGRWRFRAQDVPERWPLRWGPLRLEARFTETSKHLGVFPEQAPHWDTLLAAGERFRAEGVERPRLLNLFGYTGAATLAGAAAGFAVTHVDASKPALAWARHNQRLSGMEAAPVRWILEDALKYVRRELNRGSLYEAIVLDPPSFGRGPKKELWRVERDVLTLLEGCAGLLSEAAGLMLLTLYSLEASPIMAGNVLAEVLHERAGTLTVGELALRESGAGGAGRLLPLSLWAKFEG
ncbi:MAG: class I SAM-dependent methyltransferase [Opitutales bacterium]